jgi:hypothetical protein
MAVTDRLSGLNIGAAVKPACVVATTGANITLQGAQTIDGVSVGSCERVLVKDQTDPKENGIWSADNSTWIRTRDFDGAKDAIPGTLVEVLRGNTYATSFWNVNRTSTAVKLNIGADNQTWDQVTQSLAGVSGFSSSLLTLASAMAWRAGLELGSASTLDGTALGLLDSTGQVWVGIQSWNKGGDLASANSLTLGSTANYFDVTGGTTINTIAAVRIGTQVGMHFDSTLVLTHSTALVLPSSENISVQAGDEAAFVQYTTGADWRLWSFQRANGLPLALIDENDMVSDSSSHVPTQQSVKAYVDGVSFYKFTSTAESVGSSNTKDITAINGNGAVNEIVIQLVNVSQDSANAILMLQLGGSGGIEESGYSGQGRSITTAGAAFLQNSTGFKLTDNTIYDAVEGWTGTIVLRHFGLNTWSSVANGNNGGASWAFGGEGSKTLTSELTQIRLRMLGSTMFFDVGTIAVAAR